MRAETAVPSPGADSISIEPPWRSARCRIARRPNAIPSTSSRWAARAELTLSYLGDEVALDVVDDGVGFDPRAAHREEVDGIAFGLRAMRQRAERQGGSIEIESAPGEGTAVSARIPLEAP